MAIAGQCGSLHGHIPDYQSALYRRFLYDTDDLFAQIVVVPATSCSMRVHAHPDVLDVDFGTHSTRPDVPGTLLSRPGYHLADELDKAWREDRPALFLNGNNTGYWGNQFVIDSGELQYKKCRPIFYDAGSRRRLGNRLAAHMDGRFPFFCWTPDSFAIVDLDLHAVPMADPVDGPVSVIASVDELPATGLSGFPLLRSRRAVWPETLHQAWDPRLLFDTGRLVGVDRRGVKERIDRHFARRDPLVRHALTLVGVDSAGSALLVVVEQSDERSDGLTVADAARLMSDLGAVDALVLGAAGDAQLASTEEGFLVSPLIEEHVRASSRELGGAHLGAGLGGRVASARPIPSLVAIECRVSAPTTRSTGPGIVHEPVTAMFVEGTITIAKPQVTRAGGLAPLGRFDA